MPPRFVERRARAKVNLDLLVTGRRADGYHELDSLVVFAGAADVLRAEPAERLTLTVAGPFAAAVPHGDGNLVLAAAHALARAVRYRAARRADPEQAAAGSFRPGWRLGRRSGHPAGA